MINIRLYVPGSSSTYVHCPRMDMLDSSLATRALILLSMSPVPAHEVDQMAIGYGGVGIGNLPSLMYAWSFPTQPRPQHVLGLANYDLRV